MNPNKRAYTLEDFRNDYYEHRRVYDYEKIHYLFEKIELLLSSVTPESTKDEVSKCCLSSVRTSHVCNACNEITDVQPRESSPTEVPEVSRPLPTQLCNCTCHDKAKWVCDDCEHQHVKV